MSDLGVVHVYCTWSCATRFQKAGKLRCKNSLVTFETLDPAAMSVTST